MGSKPRDARGEVVDQAIYVAIDAFSSGLA